MVCLAVGNKMPKQEVINKMPKEVVKQNRQNNKITKKKYLQKTNNKQKQIIAVLFENTIFQNNNNKWTVALRVRH